MQKKHTHHKKAARPKTQINELPISGPKIKSSDPRPQSRLQPKPRPASAFVPARVSIQVPTRVPIQAPVQTNNPYNDPAHMKKNLVGYAEIPASEYEFISPGDHVRYKGTDGNFRTGGYVWFKRVTAEGAPYWVIGQSRLPPTGNSKKMNFVLYWSKIQKLWKKLAVDTDLLIKSIDQKQIYINDIALFLLEKYDDEFREFMNSRERLRLEATGKK